MRLQAKPRVPKIVKHENKWSDVEQNEYVD